MYAPEIETRSIEEQFRINSERYRRQLGYLFERSEFYSVKLGEAGFRDARSAGSLQDIGHLPFTEKDELRRSQAAHPPFGRHLA